MDKEYRNLLRHAETENDFIRVERIQIRKGLRTPIILINNSSGEEYAGTEIETKLMIETRTKTGTGIRTRTRIRAGIGVGTRSETRIITGIRARTWAKTETKAGIDTRIGTRNY